MVTRQTNLPRHFLYRLPNFVLPAATSTPAFLSTLCNNTNINNYRHNSYHNSSLASIWRWICSFSSLLFTYNWHLHPPHALNSYLNLFDVFIPMCVYSSSSSKLLANWKILWMEGISWVIVESSIALLDSPIHIFLICFCYIILNNSATPFPLTSLYPKLSLKVFRCYS